MIDLADISRQLTANGQAMRALLHSVSDEQAQWQPDPDSWSLKQVMEHVYNEERLDFKAHIKEILSDLPLSWGSLASQPVTLASLQQTLETFLDERESSIAWLTDLKAPDWEARVSVQFGPQDTGVLRAGDVLVSWVAHDFLHLRQMNELLYAWNEKRAAPYSVEYAGGW